MGIIKGLHMGKNSFDEGDNGFLRRFMRPLQVLQRDIEAYNCRRASQARIRVAEIQAWGVATVFLFVKVVPSQFSPASVYPARRTAIRERIQVVLLQGLEKASHALAVQLPFAILS